MPCRSTAPDTANWRPSCAPTYTARLAITGNYIDGWGCRRVWPPRARRRERGGRHRAPLAVGPRGTMGAMARLDYDELNATIRYVMFSAFAVQPGRWAVTRRPAPPSSTDRHLLKRHEDTGVVVRGIYDVAGMRADADFMFWTHAGGWVAVALYSDRRTTTLGRATGRWEQRRPAPPAGSARATCRRSSPAREPGNYVCVYPFMCARWTGISARRGAPQDAGRPRHGRPRLQRTCGPTRCRRSPLGDYSGFWPRAPELHRIVDLMRDLRATEARRHVREEIPFFTGPRVGVEELVARLP